MRTRIKTIWVNGQTKAVREWQTVWGRKARQCVGNLRNTQARKGQHPQNNGVQAHTRADGSRFGAARKRAT